MNSGGTLATICVTIVFLSISIGPVVAEVFSDRATAKVKIAEANARIAEAKADAAGADADAAEARARIAELELYGRTNQPRSAPSHSVPREGPKVIEGTMEIIEQPGGDST